MESTNITSTVYMKDILFSIFYRWKRIFAVAIAFAIILAGLYWVKNARDNAGIDSTPIIPQPNSQQLEMLQTKVDVLTAGVEEKESHLTDSIFMQLDSQKHYEISLTFYIDTNYMIQPDMPLQNPNMISAVINSYLRSLETPGIMDVLSSAIGTEPGYLREVFQFSADLNGQTIQIRAQYADEAGATTLATAVVAYFEDLHKQINDSVAEHSCTLLFQEIYPQSNNDIFTRQLEHIDNLKLAQEELKAAQQELDSLTAPIVNAPIPFSAKKALLYAVIGAFVGGFLMVCCVIVAFLADSKVYSLRTMRDRTGLKTLCCARSGRKLLPDILWLRKKEGRVNAVPEQQYPLLAANIRNRCAAGQALLISGSADPALVEQTANALRTALPELTVLWDGNILYDVAALSALAKCDCVLLAEQCRYSQYTQIINAQELIEDHNKTLLGCLLIDG